MLKKRIFTELLLLAAIALAAQDSPLVIRFVRHGQPGVKGTDFTPADKATWITLGLTPLGRKQAEQTGNYLKKENVQWERVIASPQERASETADIICGCLGKTYTLDPDLREGSNAVRETLPALRKRFKNLAPDAVLDINPRLPGSAFREDDKACRLRGRKFITKLMQEKNSRRVLLVSHGHFIYATILEMTGKTVLPWNCGMAELKVWPDGKAELVKGAYPEVFGPELITDNFTYFRKNPWFNKFKPYPGPRPDTLDFVNDEFRLLLEGKRSSWRELPRRNGKIILKTGESITLKSGKLAAGYNSPAFPLRTGREYRIAVKASGKGSGVIRLARSPHKQEFALTSEVREYELKFILRGKPVSGYEIHLESAPGSEMAVTDLNLSLVK